MRGLSSDTHLQELGCFTLCRLLCGQSAVVKLGVAAEMVTIVTAAMYAHTESEGLQTRGCMALLALMLEPPDGGGSAISGIAARAGAIEAIVAAMTSEHARSKELSQQGCAAVRIFAYTDDVRTIAIRAGIVDAVIHAMGLHGTDAEVQRGGVNVFSALGGVLGEDGSERSEATYVAAMNAALVAARCGDASEEMLYESVYAIGMLRDQVTHLRKDVISVLEPKVAELLLNLMRGPNVFHSAKLAYAVCIVLCDCCIWEEKVNMFHVLAAASAAAESVSAMLSAHAADADVHVWGYHGTARWSSWLHVMAPHAASALPSYRCSDLMRAFVQNRCRVSKQPAMQCSRSWRACGRTQKVSLGRRSSQRVALCPQLCCPAAWAHHCRRHLKRTRAAASMPARHHTLLRRSWAMWRCCARDTAMPMPRKQLCTQFTSGLCA
jgi:hypothetical protein